MQTFDQQIFIIVGSSLFLLLVISSFLLFLNSYIKRNAKHRIEKLEIQSKFSQTLLQSQLEIKEQTLTHISRELHDNLGQVASLIKINLNTISLEDRGKAEQKLEHTKELLRQFITDLKTLSANLNGDRIQQLGLAAALSKEVERLNKTGVFTATYNGPAQLNVIIDPNRMVILFRMAQEILNNMVKHSEAPHITVSLTSNENIVILALSDDGKGFDLENKESIDGSGLINLQHRAKLINARLTMQSSPGKGTQVTIETHAEASSH